MNREQTLLHAFHLGRSAVTRHDELLVVLLEVVEYMEECALCLFFAYQFLDVVNDKRVDTLVKLDKLVDLAAQSSRRELVLKQTCRNI